MNLKYRAYLLLLAIILFSVGVLTLEKIKTMQEDRASETLQTIMGTTRQTINILVHKKLEETALVSASAVIQENIQKLLIDYSEREIIPDKAARERVHMLLKPWLIKQNALGFCILATNGSCLMSFNSEQAADPHLFLNKSEWLQSVLTGQGRFFRPASNEYGYMKKSGAAKRKQYPMLFVTPVYGVDQNVLGIFVVQLDPVAEFARAVQMARFGRTADFYMVDRTGVLISPVRFSQGLRNLESLTDNEPLVGRVRVVLPASKPSEIVVRDKGEQLTHAVAETVAGRSGMDVKGYPDYRGVEVIGIWKWDEELGLGMVYEIDLSEAYQSYYSIRTTVIVSMISLFLVLGFIFWIVDRKKHQLANTNKSLHGSEQKLRTVLGVLSDGVILVDENLSVQIWNKGAVSLFGYTAEEVIGNPIYDLIVPSRYRGKIKEQIPYFQKTGQVWREGGKKEFTAVNKSGQEFPVEMKVTPLYLEGSWHAVGVIHDIRSRKAKEAEIEQSEKRLNHAQILARVGYWEFDTQSGECRLSVEASNILGMNSDGGTLDLAKFLEIIHKDDREKFDRLTSNQPDEDFFSFEHRVATTGGQGRYFQQHCSRERGEKGDSVLIRCAIQDITASKEEAKRYRRLTERFKMATSTAEMGVWEWDMKKDSVYWDDQMFNLYGLSPANFSYTSKEWFAALHEEDLESTTEMLQRTIDEGSQFSGVFRIRRPDGKVRHIKGVARVYMDRYETPDRMVGINYDISDTIEARDELEKLNNELKSRVEERTSELEKSRKAALSIMQDAEIQKKRAEAALEELKNSQEKLVQSEERFRGLVESIHDIIWEHDAKGRISYISPTVKNVAGFEQEELIGKTGFRLLPPEDCRMAVGVFQKAGREGRSVRNLEYRVRHKDGRRVINLETNATPVYAADGTLLGFRGVSRDVTERKYQEEALRKLSRAIEASPITVLITDVNANIEYVNPKFTEVTGYTAEEVIGRTPKFLQSGEHTEDFYENLWKDLLAGKQWHGEFCNRKKDGTIMWEKASISPIFNDKREITHFVEVKEDVTEKKQVEKELRDAVARAEEATRSKSDFLANMSHEIRTPMNAIIGMSHIVLQSDLNAKQEEYIDVIHSSAQMLLNLINDILDFSKIEAGKLGLEETPFSIANLLEGITRLIAGKLADTGVEFILNIDQRIPAVLLGDPTRLGQIFSNLLSNAAKFTQEGEIEVNVRLLELQKDNLCLECSVEDTGIGIDVKQLDKLFQKFSQADTSTTRKYGGTGLGLAICKQLLEMMGGNIRVESQVGAGSRFVFQVPLKYREDRRKGSWPPQLPPALRNLGAVLIDQNPKKVDSLLSQLDSLKVDTKGFGSVGEAVLHVQELVEGGKSLPDLILLDYRTFQQATPGERSAILGKSREYNVPILWMAYMQEKAAVEKVSADSAFAGIVEKPVSESMLFNMIVESFGYHDFVIRKRREPILDLEKLAVSLQNKKILVAEDNQINQKVATELLQQVGITPDIANDGEQAFRMCLEKKYDLVLMDIQMPVLDGIAATRKIRGSNPLLRDMPIVAMTAHAMVDDKKKSLQAGLNDHITKPINPAELYDCLARQLLTRKERKRLVSESRDNLRDEHVGAHTVQGVSLKDLRQIPGLDFAVGLHRVNGNKELYLHLLKDFYLENEETEQRLVKLLAGDKREEGTRLVHSLKGLAGSIGALELQKYMRKLELAIKERPDNLEPEFGQACCTLRVVLEGIKSSVLDETESLVNPESAPPGGDTQLDWQMIDRLKQCLQAGDMESELIFNRLKPSLSARLPEETRALTSSMNSLDHETALDLILLIEKTLRKVND